jgi:DNA repair protein RecN (Recombination protein N)
MLTELHIENIAVIEKADIEFGPGLNILTGETGAGKSIVIDSLGAVLGARTSRELIRTGADRGTVTAVFETSAADGWLSDNGIDHESELILQRRLTEDGKSSCRVCGMPVTAQQLRELGGILLDIHGQNDGRQLMDETRHHEYLDHFGGLSGELAAYRREYDKYCSLVNELKQLDMDESEKERLSESLRYTIEELDKADIRPGEEDEKTARRDLLHNAEKITDAVDAAYSALYESDTNASALVGDAAALIGRVKNISDELGETYSILTQASDCVSDAVERLKDFRDSLDFSPEEYDALEDRLAQLRRLERKYGTDESGLAQKLQDSRRRLESIEYSGDMAEKLKVDISAQAKVCRAAALELSSRRSKAAVILEGRIVDELRALSMPSVKFAVEFSKVPGEAGFDAYGADDIRFLMSANAGEAPGRISRIASGGELSRIMLAMKNVFAENDAVGTMVFDEIDAGVSGIAAQRVGEKLADLSKAKQVLCVTHLPQIAAMADSHYVIKKSESGGRTYTSVTKLDTHGRELELARLHGGDNITATTIASASEQLEYANKYKRGDKT